MLVIGVATKIQQVLPIWHMFQIKIQAITWHVSLEQIHICFYNHDFKVYARSAFGTSAEYFWIGLSRNESSGSLSWDNGLPVVYTNLGSYLGQNYFSEKISNTKWDTLGDNSTNYFVCSYASTSDQATSTEPRGSVFFEPKLKTHEISATNNCQPGGQQTILFAYSNDLDPSVVTDTLINSYLSSQPVTFAVSRFDLRQPEDIGYFNTYK